MNALFIDTVINLEQYLSRFDIIKILHVDGGDIATDLRTDKGGLSAHIGVIGELTVPGKRRQLPGVQNRQYADKADGGGGKIDTTRILLRVLACCGRILLTHNDSRVKLSMLFAARRAFQRDTGGNTSLINRQNTQISVPAEIAAVRR